MVKYRDAAPGSSRGGCRCSAIVDTPGSARSRLIGGHGVPVSFCREAAAWTSSAGNCRPANSSTARSSYRISRPKRRKAGPSPLRRQPRNVPSWTSRRRLTARSVRSVGLTVVLRSAMCRYLPNKMRENYLIHSPIARSHHLQFSGTWLPHELVHSDMRCLNPPRLCEVVGEMAGGANLRPRDELFEVCLQKLRCRRI